MTIAPVRLLAGLMAALALLLLVEWVAPGGGEQPGRIATLRLTEGASKAPLVARAASNWARIVLARPLFSISRRPPREAAGPQAAAPDEARLSGIMIGRFGRKAIFAPQGGGKPLVLAEGAQVNESTIRSIESDRVVLASGAVLTPMFDRNRVPTPYTPPPFQPVMPNFPNPGFGGNIPQPGFPRMPMPPQEEPGQAQPGQPMPMFRGPNFPNRRD